MHKYASVYLLEAELFSTRQTNILAILASSETINIWGKRQLFWGKRQLASPCCNCINFFLPAYFEKQPGISLYRALSKCIAHACCPFWGWSISRRIPLVSTTIFVTFTSLLHEVMILKESSPHIVTNLLGIEGYEKENSRYERDWYSLAWFGLL